MISSLPSPRFCRVLVVLLAAALTGCVTRPPAPVTAAWSAEDMARISRFDLHGKVGFRRGDSGGSAALVWQQDGDRYRLTASGPLGAGAVRIDGNSSRIRIDSGGETRESQDPAGLLAEAIGWPVAVNSLAYWARGLAAPGAAGEAGAEITLDGAGLPALIRQQGWDIALDRWRADGARLLPYRVVATGGDSRVTLLIERWVLPPAQHGAARRPVDLPLTPPAAAAAPAGTGTP